ncbi:MAG: hypothetical protein JXB40_03400 [Candidatus Omnitrophica bacterium]|nr:hypothetical protein [Candidatus Omnitrophota bacterium]
MPALKNLLCLSFFLIALQASSLYADNQRVMVALYNSKSGADALARKASAISAGEVIASKEFNYISPGDFIRAMMGGSSAVPAAAEPVNLEKEYSEEYSGELEDMSRPYKGRIENLFKMLEMADILVGGNVGMDGDFIRIEIMAARLKNYREYSAVIETTPARMDAELRHAVRDLLKKASKSEKVYADKLTDAELSKVTYMVKSSDGKDIIVEADYTGDRPDPELQSLNLLLPDGADKDGVVKSMVKSLEGKAIGIEFSYNRGKPESVKVSASIPDPLNMDRQSEVLTIKSRGGYLLNIEFVWKDGLIESVRISPKVNPFSDFN